jgi:anaerobic ribonucleoside-triphosphate reductase
VKKNLLKRKKKIKKVLKKTKKVLKKKSFKKRRRKRKIKMDDIYKILNKVQINKKPNTFATSFEESDTIENVIKDALLEYKKTVMVTQVVFNVYPNKNLPEPEDILQIEYLDDEVPQSGQIFG